jgi:hypothetical protein
MLIALVKPFSVSFRGGPRSLSRKLGTNYGLTMPRWRRQPI